MLGGGTGTDEHAADGSITIAIACVSIWLILKQELRTCHWKITLTEEPQDQVLVCSGSSNSPTPSLAKLADDKDGPAYPVQPSAPPPPAR